MAPFLRDGDGASSKPPSPLQLPQAAPSSSFAPQRLSLYTTVVWFRAPGAIHA